ncbi:MAG: hypothetical protein GXY77_10785 [Fibrobacter sp.]|nr:hypothetical protein [Fibrobacter sp.]
MNNQVRLQIVVIVLITMFFFLHSCKKTTIPIVTTMAVTEITTTTAVSGGEVTDDGGSDIIVKGVCWDISDYPEITNNKSVDGKGTGDFSSNLKDLSPGVSYYVRAYATNDVGTGYGNTVSFTTLNGILFNPQLTYGTVDDIENNTYKTIQIGNQTWMAENLKTTKFNDGTEIPLVEDNNMWSDLFTPGFSWYENDELIHKSIYGALYNWYAVETEKICPSGWHVPTRGDWSILIDYLGGINVAGVKLMETGNEHWNENNNIATNLSGFTALPGGIRRFDGTFNYKGGYANWWLATSSSASDAWRWYMDYNTTVYETEHDKRYGFSIRCIKD